MILALWSRKGGLELLDVVVKELHGDMKVLLEKFKAEAMNLAKLDHPNVITYYRFCSKRILFLIVIEFMNKGALNEILKRSREGRSLGKWALLQIIYQVLGA